MKYSIGFIRKITNKNIILSSFKSSGNILRKRIDQTDPGFRTDLFRIINSLRLAIKARESILVISSFNKAVKSPNSKNCLE